MYELFLEVFAGDGCNVTGT